MTIVKVNINLAANMNWGLFQLNVNNAFIHGDLKEEVYIIAPKGVSNPHNVVRKLKKSLYGLK